MKEQWLMRVLWGMLVVAALLAGASLAIFQIARAARAQPEGCPRTWTETRTDPCGTCDWYKQWVRYFWCYEDPCFGTPQRCIEYRRDCVWCWR